MVGLTEASKALKGKAKSKEFIKNQSIAQKKRFSKNSVWNKGKKRPPFSKEWIENMKGRTPWNKGIKRTDIDFNGEKHPNWQGGKSFEPYPPNWTKNFKNLIRKRDNYICAICKKFGDNVHHIDYDKQNCNLDNLITLCRSCHMKTNFNRKYWTKRISKNN